MHFNGSVAWGFSLVSHYPPGWGCHGPETKGQHSGNHRAKTLWGQIKDNALFGKPGVWKVLEISMLTPRGLLGIRGTTSTLQTLGAAGLGLSLASAVTSGRSLNLGKLNLFICKEGVELRVKVIVNVQCLLGTGPGIR